MSDKEKSGNAISLATLALFSAFLTFYGMQYQSWERQMKQQNEAWERRIEKQSKKIEALEHKIDQLINEKAVCELGSLDLQYKMLMCEGEKQGIVEVR